MLGIIKDKTLRLTERRYVNDVTEIKYCTDLIIDLLSKKRNSIDLEENYIFNNILDNLIKDLRFKNNYNDYYFACFCENGDLLSQWRAYGLDGKGFSLGFKAFDLSDSLNNQDFFLCFQKILYEEKKIENIIDIMLGKLTQYLANTPDNQFIRKHEYAIITCICNPFISILNFLIVNTKNYGFHEEDEWRITIGNRPYRVLLAEKKQILFRSGKYGITPYIEIPLDETKNYYLKEIVIGPNNDFDNTAKTLRMLFEVNNLRCIEIKKSQISYRS